ncbi:hypothetical protein SCHPADRAFT_186056 [Schizopora paradoxa]|uniref:Uncharacterized protein n=1 Tax=Schizopora paradoxa TaxID=27342 RepID=A0A0H2S5X0_9AGAM|nr:hypothetical protein SCHPADRAFT_186056 [Schizopora paradoxa]
MQIGRRSPKIDEVEIQPLANDSLSPIPDLSGSPITVPCTGTVCNITTGPGSVHLNATTFSPTAAALADLSLNSTATGTFITTSSLASTVPSLTTVRSPVSTVAGPPSTSAAPIVSSVVVPSSSRSPALKEPTAIADPSSSSSSDMAVSKSSSSPSPTTHATPTSSASKPHTSSTSAAPPKSTGPAPPAPPSTTAKSSTHSSATPLSTQRAEPSLTPSSSPSATSSPAGTAAPVTNTASQNSSTHAPSTPSNSSKTHPNSTSVADGQPPFSSPLPVTSAPSSSTSAPQTGATIHSSEAISSNWDFFDNKKAVAGVFVVVGLALLAIILGSVCYCRRLRARKLRRSVAFQTISQPITTYRPTGSLHEGLMLDGERESSHRHLMMSPSLRGSDIVSVHRSASESSHLSGDVHSPETPGRAGIGALGLTGMRTHMDIAPPGRQMSQVYRYDGPFSDYHQVPPPLNGFARSLFPQPDMSTIGMAISGGPETTPNVNKSRFSDDRAPSPTPSTPSIYPPSLPVQQDAEDSHFYEKEMRRPTLEVPVTRPLNLKVPQRVHFNELRREASASDPFADPDPDSVDDLFYLETQGKVPPPKIDTRQLYNPGPLTPSDSTPGDSSATTPSTTQSSDSDHDAKSNPFASAFLGRPVVGKIEAWARPPRSPLRNPSLSSRAGK